MCRSRRVLSRASIGTMAARTCFLLNRCTRLMPAMTSLDEQCVSRDHDPVEASRPISREGCESLPVRVHVEDSIQGHDVRGLDRFGQVDEVAMVVRDAVRQAAPIALAACRREVG